MEYTLVLDESGQFINSKNGMPAMVAGYLVNWHGLDEAWAKSQFAKAKRLRRDYKNIDTNNFHGKDIPVSISKNFLVDLIKSFVNKNVRIVEFKNQKNVFIVDSDTTYLNCFSEGVISLLKELLKETDDDINLKILYAHRQQTELREQTGQKIRIPMEQYNSRLQERLEMLRLRLPISSQKRIHFDKDYLADANAVKDARLMLADAICYTFRGGNFGSDVLDQLKELETLVYFVPEKESWNIIQDCMIRNQYAEAIFLWYAGFYQDIKENTKEFERQITSYFKDINYTERKICFTILSQYLRTLVHNRMYSLAKKYMSKIESSFILLLSGQKISVSAFRFDLHFFWLTVATHEGDTSTSQKEIMICRQILAMLPPKFESLDTYLSYQLREVEHLKNMYDFPKALEQLTSLKNTFCDMLEMIKLIDGLGEYAERMKSSTLGKVYGSLISTRAYLGLQDSDQFNLANIDFKNAMSQFDDKLNINRINQTMSMVEYLAGHYESALQYLSLAFSDTPTTDSEEVFLLLTRQKDTSAHFGLMHYTRIMMLAMVADTPLGNQMYNICQKHHLEESIKSIEYPNSIIVWSLASCAARRNEKKARGLYESAINEQVKDPQHYTNIATGVLMEIERLMTIQNIRKSYIRRLQNDYRLLIGDDSPNSIKEIFLTFYDFVHTVTESNIPLYKKDIVTKIYRIPVL